MRVWKSAKNWKKRLKQWILIQIFETFLKSSEIDVKISLKYALNYFPYSNLKKIFKKIIKTGNMQHLPWPAHKPNRFSRFPVQINSNLFNSDR